VQLTTKQLTHRWTTVYEGEPWYGPGFLKVINDISPEEAYWKVQPDAHSIIEIVHHILAYRIYMVRQISGDHDFRIKLNSPEDWTKYDTPDPEKWKEFKKMLQENQEELIRILEKEEEAFLEKPTVIKYRSNGELIYYVLEHDIYHLGQISLLKSLCRKFNK